MSLDKATLQNQLVRLAENEKTLSTTISTYREQLGQLRQQASAVETELIKLEGALNYHKLIVQQVNLVLTTEEQVTT